MPHHRKPISAPSVVNLTRLEPRDILRPEADFICGAWQFPSEPADSQVRSAASFAMFQRTNAS
jgi:hypothetical protein